MELNRRSFLKMLGLSVSAAAVAPMIPNATAAIPAAPAIAQLPKSLAEELLAVDKMFGRKILCRSVSISAERAFENYFVRSGVAVRGGPSSWTLDVDVVVDHPVLIELAQEAFTSGDAVQLDIAALRKWSIPDDVQWRLRQVRVNSAVNQLLTMQMQLQLLSFVPFTADDLDDDAGVWPPGYRG